MSRLLLAALFFLNAPLFAAEPAIPRAKQYQAFVKKQAAALRQGDKPPATLDEWNRRNAELRKNLLAAWGGFPAQPCPLEPQNHGTLQRDGYRVEKITFQTRPGIRMTANLYLPDKKGKLPAILMVHGHWRGAKQDPVVQARCIGAAKLGFVALVVDAFGAGERGVGAKLGEYHGDMTAATLLPVGLPLSGLQVYENMRAVDYLLTRPEVDPNKLGVTGASGGGNQTMYAGAFDTRFKCVVPVCSVGNYQAYLDAACCMCEVVPGALRFTEEGSILGLVAPRALMVVNATRDAVQFSVGEAKKSIAYAKPIFQLHGKPDNLKHAIFESPHDYSRAMREEMYGWMTLHLKGEGDGTPIREPEMKTENPEDLRCYPGDTRPRDWVTLPQFAAAEGRNLLATKKEPTTAEEWKQESAKLRAAFVEKSLGGFEDSKGPVQGGEAALPTVILLNCDGASKAATSALATELRKAGRQFSTLELRATGKYAMTERVGRSPDHNSAEWGLWIGRPLLGQWVEDLRRRLDSYGEGREGVVVIGEGPAGLVALCAAATDKRITKAAAVGTLASFISDVPYEGQRLGILAPGILRDVGDVAHIAALAAPKRIVIAGGVLGNGKALGAEQLRAAYSPAMRTAKLLNAEKELVIQESIDAAKVIDALK